MRTKKVSNTRFAYKLDKIFWFLISFLPLIIYISAYLFFQTSTPTSFSSFMTTVWGILPDQKNPVYYVLFNLFSQAGIFPLVSEVGVGFFYFLSYLINVEILHVFFDVIVFIPRLAHKWVSKAVQDD